MKKINLALGIHNHQPVGNFEHVFEEAFQRAYLPFFEVLEDHANVKSALHITGILFEWMLNNHPDFVVRVRKLVERGQLEMMTGGYYEPIMTMIPDEDKAGQIEKLSAFVKKHTGYDPRGMWLAERVWEPHLPQPLVQAGVQYTVVDDTHFKYAGLRSEELFGYYVTEHNGYSLKVFPINEKLRYTIPFREPEETIEYLHNMATEDGERLVVFADDGEKFGVWPGTFEYCYAEKWLDRFFTQLEENSDWIRQIHFSAALLQMKPIGRIYLPTASYREMGEWALPTPAIHTYDEFDNWLEERQVPGAYKIYVRGGFWRNFLAKYPESNNMHKRMMQVSRRLQKVSQRHENKKIVAARNHLYAGQCNCQYWHGVFGGLYLNYLRFAIYRNLIKAQKLLDEVDRSKQELDSGWVDVKSVDFNTDGHDEVLVDTDRLSAYFEPENGGCLFEFDYKPKSINLLDTMTRREEGYHNKLLEPSEASEKLENGVASIHDIDLAKEDGLEKYLNYDWYKRCSLIDHFLHPDTTIDDFAACKYGEQGDFVNQPYDTETSRRGKRTEVLFSRVGNVWMNEKAVAVKVQKQITFAPKRDEVIIKYRVENLGDERVSLWFGVEFNFALLAGDAVDRYYKFPKLRLTDNRLGSTGVVNSTKLVKLCDEWLDLEIGLAFDKSCDIWRFPIETVSMSEAGFERVYQNSVVFPNWKLELAGHESFRIEIKERLS